MTANELAFTIIKFDDEVSDKPEARLVVHQLGEVIEIYESTFRNCINRQLEMLQQCGFTETRWRLRRD